MSQENTKQNTKRSKPTYNQRITELEQKVAEMRDTIDQLHNLRTEIDNLRKEAHMIYEKLEAASHDPTPTTDDEPWYISITVVTIGFIAGSIVVKLGSWIINAIF